MELSSGVVIGGKYTLLRPLGSGAYGDVWAAMQTQLDRRVALKFLKLRGEAARQRFNLEATALGRLEHPSCVAVHDFGVFRGTPYLVTGFVEGTTLDHWLQTQPSQRDILAVARRLASALEHAHSQNIIHRDVKPANIIVTEDSDGPRPMLLDFGVAKLTGVEHRDVTQTGEVIGTPGYMSPEQLRAGVIGPAADVYSFGVVLFTMFAGAPPFHGPTQLDLAMQHLTGSVPVLEGAPAPIAACVARMLDKDPDARPPMREVRRILSGKQKRAPFAHTTQMAPHHQMAPRTRPWRFVLPLMLLLGVGAVAGLLFGEDEETVQPVSRELGQLVKSNEPTPVALRETTSDAAAVEADVGSDAGWDGRSVSRWVTLPRGRRFGMRIPSSYDDRPAPILLMLHDVLQPPEDLLQIATLNELADQHGYVLISPDDNDASDTWLSRADIDHIVASLDEAGTLVKLDRDRLFVIGHGNGGIGAQKLACRIPIVAMAHTSHRMSDDHNELCAGSQLVPTLQITMTTDPTNPISAKPDCLGHLRWSLQQHEEVMREAHRCTSTYNERGADCQDLACEVPLRLCHTTGGRDWAAMRRRLVTNNPLVCNSPPGNFDFVGEIWSFLHAN